MIDKFSCNFINSVYDFNDFTLNELICKLAQKMDEVITQSNESFNYLEWLKNQGLSDEVVDQLQVWLNDGTLSSLINNEKFDSILSQCRNDLNNFKTEINSELVTFKSNVQTNVNDTLSNKMNEINNSLSEQTNDINNLISNNNRVVQELTTSYSTKAPKNKYYEPMEAIELNPPFVSGNNFYYRIPQIIRLKNGRILALSDSRYATLNDLGNDIHIVANYSDDGGTTWQENYISVIDKVGSGNRGSKTNGVGDCSVVQNTITGRIFVFALNWKEDSVAVYNRNPNSSAYDWIYVFSDDNGESWSSPISIKHLKSSTEHLMFNGTSKGFYDINSNTIYVPAQYWDSNHMSHSTYIYSNDNGQNWIRGEVSVPSVSTECSVYLDKQNDIILNCRQEEVKKRGIYKILSSDKKYIYKVDNQNLLDATCSADVEKINDDFYLMTFQNSKANRDNLILAGSSDGITWEGIGVVNNSATDGYSSLCVNGNYLLVLYEYGNGNYKLKKYDLTEILSNRIKLNETNEYNKKTIEINSLVNNTFCLYADTKLAFISQKNAELNNLYGYDGQEVTIVNVANTPLKITCGENDYNIIKSEHYGSQLLLYPYESITLINYKRFWRIKDIHYINVEDRFINDLGENALWNLYPKGKSTVVVSTPWSIGKGILTNVNLNDDPKYNYQVFHQYNTYVIYKRVPFADNTWSPWRKIEPIV